jgi:periplasmic divalent cation tolerance protein
MAETEFVIVYSTFPDETSARKAGEALVEAKLAACVNIHAPMTSIYEWQGKMETEKEVAVFIKTKRPLAQAVIDAARKLHPYTVPCFLILPVIGGHADYLMWLREQTRTG